MIKVLFFAQVRELVGCDELSLPCDYASADALRAALSERVTSGRWRSNPASSWWRSTRPWCRWIPPP
jgi:molybdopterin converting factor small subunit